MGIDYGRVRIGLAMSDLTQTIASPITVINAEKTFPLTIQKILSHINMKECDLFVMGLPLLMNGKESEMSEEVRKFGALLEQETGKKVIFWDERLTSKEAERAMIAGNLKRKSRKENSDTVSAILILQSYLNCQKF